MPAANREDAKRKWQRLFPKWQKKFLMNPSDASAGTWLSSQWTKGLGVGCKCCRAAKLQTRFGTFRIDSPDGLQAVNFQKHAINPRHQKAVAAYLNRVLDVTIHSPPLQDFHKVVDLVNTGTGLITEKNRCMAWCISEAMKAQDRQRIGQSRAIALFRDERKGRLLLRYRAVDDNLHEHSGTLGQERDFGTGAANITKATGRMMERMCTPMHGALKRCRRGGPPTLQTELFEHLRKSVLCIAVDSAGDELLSAAIMRSEVLSNSARVLTPGLRFILRDKAHASRRIISRPWAADAYIKEVISKFARGRGSIARLIQNSLQIQQVFSGFVKSSGSKIVQTAVTNMRAAAHRFESFAKPLGRSVLHLHACIRTALQIASRPSDDMVMMAKAWLQWVDTEKCVMAAMLADTSDQSLVLTRLLDSEGIDPAVLNREVHGFYLAITALFGEQEQCLSVFGYTSVMLKLLKHQVVWTVNGTTHSIGVESGVPRDIVDRCLGRMRAYLVLARAALDAEFPSFEIAQSFRVFDLAAPLADGSQHLARIGKALDIDPLLLIAQWRDILPRAQALQPKASSTSNKDAWRAALERLDQDRRLAAAHPSEQLRLALLAYATLGVSTSGVEQQFSKSALKFTDRMGKASAEKEEAFMRIIMDLPDRDLGMTLRQAQKVWARAFGAPRASRKRPRFDLGTKRLRAEEAGIIPSETAFLTKRRAAAQGAVAAMPPAACLEPINAGGSWTEGHAKELEFQKQKLHEKAVDAAAEGTLLPSEWSCQLQCEATQLAGRKVADQGARERKAERDEAKMRGSSVEQVIQAIRGKSLYVHPACRATCGIADAIRATGLHLARMFEADVFVVPFPGQTDPDITFASALRGSYQISPGLLVKESCGTAIKLKPCGHLSKVLYVSPAFAARHAESVDFLRRVVSNIPGCRWAIHEAGWGHLKASVTKANLFALVRPRELSGVEFSGHKNTYTMESLNKRVTEVDVPASVSGLAASAVMG